MNKIYLTFFFGFCIVSFGLAQESERVSQLSEHVSFYENPGGTNAVLVRERDGGPGVLAVYRAPDGVTPDAVFLTDAHRDVAELAGKCGAEFIFIGEKEKPFLADPRGVFWKDYLAGKRFNEESCESTNRPFSPIPLREFSYKTWFSKNFLTDDDPKFLSIFQGLETPGLSPNSVSHVLDINGRRFIFSGDLIRDDGKISDIFRLQDNFPEAEIGPYHGFMARVPRLIASLEKIRTLNPDVLIPAHGPVIENPGEAIDTLISRLRAVYRNYLSTNALWWYFGERRMNASAAAIIGPDFDPETLDRMPESEKFENPDWLTGLATTRMIHSETGEVFLMDVCNDYIAEKILEMHRNGEIGNVTAMFVTHYHHDHNAGVPKVADFFSVPVYGVEPLADILERPRAYRMPCVQDIVVPITRKKDGETMKWNEFEFTFFDFPGQTFYHNALLVRRGDDRPIFFIGDSFTPTGIDDYCAWNRNLLKDGKGYLYCLSLYRKLDPRPMLVNAHVDPPFAFDDSRLDYMENALRERMRLLAELLAVPEINFGIDHIWCRLDPFAAAVKPGESTVLKMVITNHFDTPRDFRVELTPDDSFAFTISPEPIQKITIPPGAEQAITWTLTPTSENAGTGFLSARVSTDDDSLVGRCEAVLTIIGE